MQGKYGYFPFMKRGMNKYALAALCIAFMLGVAACRTVVPAPSMPVGLASLPTPVYAMHKIGPQHVQRTFATYFTDLNRDGHEDLLVGGRKPFVGFQVKWGDGKGHWRTQVGPKTGMEPQAFAVADVDKDGVLEVLIGGEGEQQGLQLWHLDSKNLWQLQSFPTESGKFRDVVLVDVNEDGWPDIVGTREDTAPKGGVYVWLNNGRGGWIPINSPIVDGTFLDIVVADVNADGHVDIVAARRGGGAGAQRLSRGHWLSVGGVQIWHGDGTGRWEPELLPAENDVESVTVADVNGDGRMDIVAGLYLQGIELWLDQGKGKWDHRRVTDKGTWGALRVGDINGDGHSELVAASKDGRGLGLWQWSEDNFHRLNGWLPNRGVFSTVELGDVYGRGLLDVAAIRENGSEEVWSSLRAKPLPATTFAGKSLGRGLRVYFDTASAQVDANDSKELITWLADLGDNRKIAYFHILSRADIRPVHSEVFSNNVALSKARAESVAALLREQGIPNGKITIKALGAKTPMPPGLDKEALRQNRRVQVLVYPLRSVRLPPTMRTTIKSGDLFHIKENKVFKNVNGIAEYRVGSGDELSITLWSGKGKGTKNKVTVQNDGTISLPFFPSLPVKDLTPSEVIAFITGRLKQFVRHPRVDMHVLQAKSKSVNIFGQVQSIQRQPTGPGTYYLEGKETVVQFVSRAGGTTKEADLTKVQLIRNGKSILLNLSRAIQQADWRENAIIDDGDRIFIPSLAQSKRRVYVLGEVKKPGVVEFSADIRLLDAISKAGGFGDDAYYPDIRVIRANRDKPLIMAVAFNRLMEQGDLTQNLALNDKDVVIIPSGPIANWNRMVKKMMPTINALNIGSLTGIEVNDLRNIIRGASSGAASGAFR